MKMKKNKIVVVVSSHLGTTVNNEFISHINRTIGVPHKVVLKVNNNEFSLPELYNDAIDKYSDDNTIMVFCHPDIQFKTKKWGVRLLGHFNNSNYGILGLAGSTYLSKTGKWWEDPRTMFGIVNHTDGKKEWESKFSQHISGIQPVVTIDGVFIAVDPIKLKHEFDENYGKFHFYDLSFCVPNYLDGVDLGVVTTIRILHKSVGETNEDWETNRVKFSNEYSDELPVIIEPDYNDLSIVLDKTPKVSVIIPTKNNFDILERNIESWKNIVNYPNYEILIADTGSDPDVIEKYDTLLDENIKLIKYDYYNFGEINNDVVLKHTTENSELVLFCNDDIELLNDTLSRCVEIYNKNKNIGTIGIRLHYENGSVQHGGVFFTEDSKGMLHLGHVDITKSTKYFTGVNYKSQGNTGAFMLMKRHTFIELGCFNERYVECFEDVELNFKCLLDGKKHITVSDAVAFHYESVSRNKDPKKLEKLQTDYLERLLPFYKENRIKLRKFINQTQRK